MGIIWHIVIMVIVMVLCFIAGGMSCYDRLRKKDALTIDHLASKKSAKGFF